MKMNCKSLILSLICLFYVSLNVQAAKIKQVYEVSMPVVSQENEIRDAAFQQGFIEVSVRVSGTSLAPTQLDLTQARRMVSQYRYQAMTQDEINLYMKQNTTLVAPKYNLWMRFDDGKIKQILQQNGLPVWGYQRPNVLIWLAVKDGRNRYLLKSSDRSQIKEAVEKEAARRGLPIVWPEYDVDDRKIVKFSDVWGQFWEPMKQASKRYPVDAIVLGRMNWVNGSWQVNWSLLLEDKTENWQLTAVDLDMLMSSGVGVATDHISSRFAVFAGSENDGKLVVRISGLNTVKKYASVSHYLSSLAPVKNVFAREVNQQYVDFQVELSGDENDLKRIIALGKVLTPDTRVDTLVDTASSNSAVSIPGQAPVNSDGENNRQSNQLINQAAPIDTVQKDQMQKDMLQKPQFHILRYRMNG